jgi:hypothetical protein
MKAKLWELLVSQPVTWHGYDVEEELCALNDEKV